MSTLPFGIYVVTLPWHGHGLGPTPPVQYSLLYDDDTQSGAPAFHEPNDDTYWGSEYTPISYSLCQSEADIAGASSGPSLAAPLPPGIGLVPKKPK